MVLLQLYISPYNLIELELKASAAKKRLPTIE